MNFIRNLFNKLKISVVESKKNLKLYIAMVIAISFMVGVQIVAYISEEPVVNLAGSLVGLVIVVLVFVSFVRQNAILETVNNTLFEYQSIFDMSLDMMCVANSTHFLKVNKSFANKLGYTEEELLTNPYMDFVHPDDVVNTDIARDKVHGDAKQPVIGFQNRYRTKSGEWRWLSWMAVPAGLTDIVYAVARDMTEQNLELVLRRSNKELEQFAYVASHDLKAPLRAINNLVGWVEEELTERKIELSDDNKKHIALIHDRISRMNALIEGILQYSRVGRVYADEEKLDANKVVADVLISLEKKNFIFTIDKLPNVKANKITFHQLFVNLIGNSIKHHPRDDGHVWITAKELGTMYEFSVKDDGSGIDPIFRSKLFGMFQTFKPKTPDSTGIGLALCQKIVEHSGGKIWLEPEGSGANFKFTWPK